jgi:hypothetical protein
MWQTKLDGAQIQYTSNARVQYKYNIYITWKTLVVSNRKALHVSQGDCHVASFKWSKMNGSSNVMVVKAQQKSLNVSDLLDFANRTIWMNCSAACTYFLIYKGQKNKDKLQNSLGQLVGTWNAKRLDQNTEFIIPFI